MKLLLILFIFVNFGHSQEAGEGGGGSDGDGGNYVHPDQFINKLVDGYFKCPGCSAKPSFATYQQAEFANQLNRNWIHHMEHKLNLWGYYLNSPPPIIVNVFDQPNVQLKHGDKSIRNAQSLMNDEMVTPRPEPLDSNLIKLDDIGHVFGGGLRDTQEQMSAALLIGETQAVTSSRHKEFQKIPKITTKQDMRDARTKAENTESDVYFVFFHNEADERNKHIKPYLECKEKYGHMANFYRTDTGFALLWAEKIDIYRVFNTIVAVHPQSAYVVRNDNPTITEKATYLPDEYQYYDQFVQLQKGDYMNFARLHLDFGEEESEDSKEFPHVDYADKNVNL